MKLLSTFMRPVLLAFLLSVALPASALRGDVNNDGSVNTADVSAIYQEMLSPSLIFFNAVCDINGDGAINSGDVSSLYGIILNGSSVDNEDDKFAACYATLRSEQKIAGSDDVSTNNFLRQLWNLNELSTDEALCTWSDPGLEELAYGHWGSDLPQSTGMWMRLCTSINVCNDYLSDADKHDDQHNAEVRFLRALYCYYFIDLFGNAPMSETADLLTAAPMQSRSDLFAYVEKELKAIESDLAAPRKGDYGRADQAAAWLLLSRLYLNAEVYTGTPRWAEAKTYAKKVVDSDYNLVTEPVNGFSAYQTLFMGDNDVNGAQAEILLPIMFDGSGVADYANAWEYSGMTYLIAATFDYDMYENYIGALTNNYWGGLHATEQFVTAHGVSDAKLSPNENVLRYGSRSMFYGVNHNITNDNLQSFTDGYAYPKFLNNNAVSTGVDGTEFARTDFSLLRVAEAYLTLAEADVRINSVMSDEGLACVNALRGRAGESLMRRAPLSILFNEWMREFGFEAHRRTDMIRFNRFGGNIDYTWAWRGGEYGGTAFDASRNVYGIPAAALAMNSNLTQNPGYDVVFDPIYLTVSGNYDLSGSNEMPVSWTKLNTQGYIAKPKYHVELSPNGNFRNSVDLSVLDYRNYSSGDYVRFDDVADTLSYSISPATLRKIVKWYCKGVGDEVTSDHRFSIRVVVDASGIGSQSTSAVRVLFRNYPEGVTEQWWYSTDHTGSSIPEYNGKALSNTNVFPMVLEEEDSRVLVVADYLHQNERVALWDTEALTLGLSQGHAIVGGTIPGGGSFYSSAEYTTSDAMLIEVKESGYYKLSLNVDTHELTVERLTDVPTYNSISMPGTYNTWNVEDISMQPVDLYGPNHTWSGSICIENYSESFDGEFKFAADGAWNTNWGATSYPVGLGVNNGPNIPLPGAGNYVLFFNDILGAYYIIPN